jgi:non-ribosomal peptide synthetase component E (peptide arylation enzyme)
MHTSPTARIRALTDAGYWGSETLHSILAARVAGCPPSLA